MPNVSLARSASHFRVQESENKNREARIRAKTFCKYRPFAPFAVEIGFHLILVVLSIIHTHTESLGFAALTANLYRLNPYRRLGTARSAPTKTFASFAFFAVEIGFLLSPVSYRKSKAYPPLKPTKA
jgi:hypothetical protein